MAWSMAAGLMGMAIGSGKDKDGKAVTFEVRTPAPLQVGEQVFVTGNHPMLGSWDPAGFPLTRVEDGVWKGMVPLPPDETIEYKITRGSWETEEAGPDGTGLANRSFDSGKETFLHHEINRWKDGYGSPSPHVTGNYKIHEGFHSEHLRFDRRLTVWLPPAYDASPNRRYPVLYIQDGERAFDAQDSRTGQEWHVDEWCNRLTQMGQIDDLIVVAIHSTEDRFVEYHPSMAGQAYEQFFIKELKPFIDSTYRTLPGRSAATAGVSVGGLMSFCLAWNHPEIFFGTACLSPAFRLRNNTHALDMVAKTESLPDLKIFLYGGRGDPTEEELTNGIEELVDLLKKRGFRGSLLVKENQKAGHDDTAWAEQTLNWLTFLFGQEELNEAVG